MAVEGGYTLITNLDEQSLEIDYSPKYTERPLPDEQKQCAVAISNFFDELERIRDLLSDGVPPQPDANLKQSLIKYAIRARHYFFVGCVKLNPEPNAQIAQLKKLRDQFYEDIVEAEVTKLRRPEFNYALISAFLFGLLFSMLMQFEPFPRIINASAIAHFCLVGLGSSAAIAVTPLLRNRVEAISDFIVLRRDLANPARHIASTVLATIFIGLCLQQDVVKITIGKADSGNITKDATVAILTGFVVGLAAAPLLRKLWTKYNKSTE